jgi:hypothetical protein
VTKAKEKKTVAKTAQVPESKFQFQFSKQRWRSAAAIGAVTNRQQKTSARDGQFGKSLGRRFSEVASQALQTIVQALGLALPFATSAVSCGFIKMESMVSSYFAHSLPEFLMLIFGISSAAQSRSVSWR